MEHISIIGAGDMGHGFAVHFALHDWDVTVVDHRQSNLDEASERIEETVEFLRDEDLTSETPEAVLDRVSFTLDRADGVADADVVLESVPEELEIKREVFEDLAESAPADALLASNTSGIPVTDIAEGNEAADRIVGCHWWYPPYLLTPVEVVRGERTSDETVARTESLLEGVDRDPIVAERDVPGFVWNRIQFAVLRECLHLAEEGVASLEDINAAVRDGYARRTSIIGPMETADIAGLDLFETNARNLYPHLCDDDEPGELFADRLESGRGGIEDGAGFFEYDESPEEITRDRDEHLAALKRVLDE
ncbi:3-hydroxyacyl-CoA dehydrogenase family protein [Halopenitus salinus]|jgi:3-hydroxybutyryl-CoA dehydrogenase|uniref:3-hydroxyacyl-CoA dehydrogenase family protein n=1 Tax=Halopenitus salinus TaxID=1198295 RepID=A0ABD5UXJ8_9EURY